MSLKIINYKYLGQQLQLRKQTPIKNVCKISSDSRTIEKVNPSHILHDPLV